MLVSMLCWGSWANTRKLTAGYPFSLFYWDYVVGIFVGSLLWGFTLGNIYGGPTSFVANLRSIDTTHVVYAIAAADIRHMGAMRPGSAADLAAERAGALSG